MLGILNYWSLSGPLILINRDDKRKMKQDCILLTWHVSHDSDACICDRQRLPTDTPCIREEEAFKHKDTSADQLKPTVYLQILRKACRMNITKCIQQWQQSGALFEWHWAGTQKNQLHPACCFRFFLLSHVLCTTIWSLLLISLRYCCWFAKGTSVGHCYELD